MTEVGSNWNRVFGCATGAGVLLMAALGGGCAGKTGPAHDPRVSGDSGETGAVPAHDSDYCADRPSVTLEERYPGGGPARRRVGVKDDEGEFIDHGLTTIWYENGQKKSESTFDCGVMNGPRVAWFQDGALWSQGAHVHGKGDGTWTVWYPDGSKSQEFTMVRGAWNGLFSTWYPNGQKRMEVEYVNGLRQGMMRIWDEEGHVIQQTEYRDGKAQPTPRP